MKKYIPTIILLISILGAFASQSGSKFPIDSTSIWKIDHIRNGVSDEKKHIEGDQIYNYFVKGDTIIGSFSYFKIFKTGYAYLDKPLYFENVYVGALRDKDNKFFFIEKKKTNEMLLYDFNAEIDDTIQVPYEGVFEEKIVSSIDTLPDGRKLIHFNPKEPMMGCGDQYIIEGIGGSGGLLEGPACNHFWTFDNHLVCYSQNNVLKYHDYNFQFNCDITNIPTPENYIDSTCVWRVDKQIDNDSLSDFEKLDYFVCGDTLIGTNNYLKICKTGFQLTIEKNGQFTSGFNLSRYVGAMREAENNFYFIEDDSNTVSLLYNFNLEAGNVIDSRILKGDTVKTIDSVLDNRKILYLSDNVWEKYIIQGIGSDKGLFENRNEYSTLVCFMKNGSPVYHNGSGIECNLTYDQYNFYQCDKLKIIPENPHEDDYIKAIARVCYTVSAESPVYPTLINHPKTSEDNSINIKLNYNYDDRNNVALKKIVVPVFDTIDIGRLHAGEYFIDLNVTTTHTNAANPYTVEYEKNLYLPFSVSQSTGINNMTDSKPFKIYQSPVKDFIIIERKDQREKLKSAELYTILGTKVETISLEKQNRDDKIEIDTKNFNRGIYLITINTSNSIFTQKVIIN